MSNVKLINSEIDEFYSETSEETRLKMGLGPLEFERNKELIQRYLSNSTSVIIDVGGGPGIYAEWLAKKDHEVYLIDPVAKHIDQAKRRAEKLKRKFKCIQGESRHLDFPDNFADMVILHGPLYHLQQREERIDCIKEAKRVLKPGGIVLGFAINYTASTFVALSQGVIHNPVFFKMCMEELTTGVHNAPKSSPGMLPKAFYHRPEELRSEFEEVNFEYIDICAVEGIVWLDKNYFESRSDENKKQSIMDLLKVTEKDKNIISLSPHMMISMKKK